MQSGENIKIQRIGKIHGRARGMHAAARIAKMLQGRVRVLYAYAPMPARDPFSKTRAWRFERVSEPIWSWIFGGKTHKSTKD